MAHFYWNTKPCQAKNQFIKYAYYYIILLQAYLKQKFKVSVKL